MIYGLRRMIYLLRKHDIISVPSYAAGIYHPPKVDIISKIYHPFRKERISLKNDKFLSKLVVFHGSGRRIRTLTYGVRVRCATITQSRCVPDEQILLYRFEAICQHLISGNLKNFAAPPRPVGTGLPSASYLSSPAAGLQPQNTSSGAFSAAGSAQCR